MNQRIISSVWVVTSMKAKGERIVQHLEAIWY